MSSNAKRFLVISATSLLISTLLGAYASHGLADYEPRALAAIDTAIRYQFYHGLALLAVAALDERLPGRSVAVAGWAFTIGTLLFCGGIYASSLLGWSPASQITPFGGIAFVAGWAALIHAGLRAPAVRREG
ncbi:MAG: DUF423 domain-containing protein [Gammaproteobacteria bacterium]|nr:DUF423 domain-containing protein [Gammaproteobacteria bacterium]